MEYAPLETVGAILDRLPNGDVPPYVPERVGPGRMAQHRPLPGPRLPTWSSGNGSLLLHEKLETFPLETEKLPRIGRLTVSRDIAGDNQDATTGKAPPGVDISRYLASY